MLEFVRSLGILATPSSPAFLDLAPHDRGDEDDQAPQPASHVCSSVEVSTLFISGWIPFILSTNVSMASFVSLLPGSPTPMLLSCSFLEEPTLS